VSPLEFMSQFPNHGDFSRRSRVLLFGYYLRTHESKLSFVLADLKQCFTDTLLKVPTDLSAIVSSLAKGAKAPLLKQRSPAGYALSLYGVNEVEAILPIGTASPDRGSILENALPLLRGILAKVTDQQRRAFLAEAISCLEVKARRATVILSWIAAMDHLYDFVIAHHLPAFNAALQKNTKLSSIVIAAKDDFGDVGEADFIMVCRSANVVTKDVRKILDEKLGFRNSCAHPTSIAIGDSKVVSFVEDLVDNVIAKHPI
jgi:hypothetical protein